MWCLFAALVVGAVAIALPRVVAHLELAGALGPDLLRAGASATGVAAAAVWTIVSRRTALDAAIEIDRRFELRERVASSISLSETEQHTHAGQALVKDADPRRQPNRRRRQISASGSATAPGCRWCRPRSPSC